MRSLNPFGTGQCLSTKPQKDEPGYAHMSQSLWNRAMSFDMSISSIIHQVTQSQSLWNRAMSFDENYDDDSLAEEVSQSLWNRAMSFDNILYAKKRAETGLNPFGTGQCLSTA